MSKIIGLVIFIFGLIASFSTYNHLSPFWFQEKNKKIENLWQQDMELLIKNDKLPRQWLEISEIKVQPLSESAEKLLNEIRVPMKAKPEGNYRIEISLDDWTENNKEGIMIQYQLFDKTTQNLIWELGRTLEVELHNKK